MNITTGVNAIHRPGRFCAVFSRRYKVLMVPFAYKELEMLAQAGAERTITFAVARTVPLEGAIEALTEFEVQHIPKGGKLVIKPWATA